MNQMDEFKKVFFTEATELLADMEDRLLKLQEGQQDLEQLNAIFRCAHSIKGGSGAFGFDAMMSFTHVTEALLDAFREGRLAPSRESIDLLLKAVDLLHSMLSAAKAGQPLDAAGAALPLMDAMRSITAAHDASPIETSPAMKKATRRIYDISFAPSKALFTTGNEPAFIFSHLRSLGKVEMFTDISEVPSLDDISPTECYLKWSVFLTTTASEADIRETFEFVEDIAAISIELLPGSEEVVVEPHNEKRTSPQEVSAPSAAAPTAPVAAATGSIRVDLEKIDRLVNMVGELVITEAMLRAQMRSLTADRYHDLARGIDELSHHTRELQEAVMAVRMQPVKSVFSRMPRIVRDTAAQLGKNIQLVMSGENTEVDKTVIEQLGDPLTHMIRNSVDHGIETPENRKSAGKPETGNIQLSAYHRSGHIIIQIQDDGAGINRQRVLAKAIEKGLVKSDATLSNDEIDHLIFLPGFSTAETVTSVSGRGVGMDVVRRNIEGLGGQVRITNTPGKGSTFTVSLPLTLAILDGMIIRVADETYIIPISNIIETIRPKPEDVHVVQAHGKVVNVRGEYVPLMSLQQVFNSPHALGSKSEDDLIVLVESGKSKLGLIVDELLGQQQVVIKSLEDNADHVPGISGATILGDGRVSLILEINELEELRSKIHHTASGHS